MAKEKKVRIIARCMNDKCNNFKQELNEGSTVCSLCNEPAVLTESNVNPKLATFAIVVAIAGFIITFGGGWILGIVAEIAGLAALPAGVVLGVMSKSKAAIIIPSIILLGGVALFAYYQTAF